MASLKGYANMNRWIHCKTTMIISWEILLNVIDSLGFIGCYYYYCQLLLFLQLLKKSSSKKPLRYLFLCYVLPSDEVILFTSPAKQKVILWKQKNRQFDRKPVSELGRRISLKINHCSLCYYPVFLLNSRFYVKTSVWAPYNTYIPYLSTRYPIADYRSEYPIVLEFCKGIKMR